MRWRTLLPGPTFPSARRQTPYKTSASRETCDEGNCCRLRLFVFKDLNYEPRVASIPQLILRFVIRAVRSMNALALMHTRLPWIFVLEGMTPHVLAPSRVLPDVHGVCFFRSLSEIFRFILTLVTARTARTTHWLPHRAFSNLLDHAPSTPPQQCRNRRYGLVF